MIPTLDPLTKLLQVRTAHRPQPPAERSFNIFMALHHKWDERRLYSRFFSALLDRDAAHGLGARFLAELLKQVPEAPAAADFGQYRIYPSEADKRERHHFDVYITDPVSQTTLLIENKIWAGDSNHEGRGQLEYYYDHATKELGIPDDKLHIVYLTPTGWCPSRESLGPYADKGFPLTCLSYVGHIRGWLQECQKELPLPDTLASAITQFQSLIDDMSHTQAQIDERNALRDTIGSNEELMTASKYLLDNFSHVKWHTIYDFWKGLKKEMEATFEEVTSKWKEDHLVSAINQLAHKHSTRSQDIGGYYATVGPYRVFVYQYPEGSLYYGLDIPPDEHTLSDSFIREHELEENTAGDPPFYERGCLVDDEALELKDFTRDNTFGLINPAYRKQAIQQIITQLRTLADALP